MQKEDQKDVGVLGPGDTERVVSVLSESFFDYPVMRYVIGSEPEYSARLETLVTFFVMARVLRGEVLLGVEGAEGLAAAAMVSDPYGGPSPDGLAVIREETWGVLGQNALARYEAFGEATTAFDVEGRHIHLNMIGVRRSAQGQGLGRVLLEAVHRLSASDESSAGVSLTTEYPSNVPLYEHFGYEVIGSAKVGSGFTTWGMYRPDR